MYSYDPFGPANQMRDMAEAGRNQNEAVVQKRMQDLGIPRELAEYLLDLELRVNALEASQQK